MLLSTFARRTASSAFVASLAVGAFTAPASAQDFVLPSCPSFDVGVTIGDGAGNPIHVGPRAVFLAGTMTVALDNQTTGATQSVRTAGAARTAPGPNGSTIWTVTGPSILFLFPSDPGGPSTTLYQGRLVFNQSADNVTTIKSSTGGTVDLCAALSR